MGAQAQPGSCFFLGHLASSCGSMSLASFFDAEINFWWCLGDTWRCTPAEALGLWLIFFFYIFLLVGATVVHAVIQTNSGTWDRNEAITRKQTEKDDGGYCFVF